MNRQGRTRFVWVLAMGLGILAAGVAGTGCGAAKTTGSYERIDQRKQEIAMLWAQIRAWRQDAGLRGVEPPAREIIKMHGKSVSWATGVCPVREQPRTEQCRDMCSLAEAICENAQSICRIASELNGDGWARDKCDSAKASCREAKQACCRCRQSEPPAAAAPDSASPNRPADRSAESEP